MVKMDDQLECVSIVLERMQKSLKCSICFDLMENPYTTKCFHSFCMDCLDSLLKKSKGSAKCPLCTRPVTKRSLTQNGKIQNLVKAVRKVIASIKVDCGEEVPAVKKGTEKLSEPSVSSVDLDTDSGPRRSTRKKEVPVDLPAATVNIGKDVKKTEIKKDPPAPKTTKKKPPIPKKVKPTADPKGVVKNTGNTEEKVKEWLQKSSNMNTEVNGCPSVDIFSQETILLNPLQSQPEINTKISPIKVQPEKAPKKPIRKCSSTVNIKEPKSKKLTKTKAISKSVSDLAPKNDPPVTNGILSHNESHNPDRPPQTKKKNLRFASDIKTTLLDQAKTIPAPPKGRARKDPKPSMKMLNITGGEEKSPDVKQNRQVTPEKVPEKTVDGVPHVNRNDAPKPPNHEWHTNECGGNGNCEHRIPCEVFMWLKKFFTENACVLETKTECPNKSQASELIRPRSPDRRSPSTDSSIVIEADNPVSFTIPAKSLEKPIVTVPPSPEALREQKRKRDVFDLDLTDGTIKDKPQKRYKRIKSTSSDESEDPPAVKGPFQMDSEEIRDYERLDKNIMDYFARNQSPEPEPLPDPKSDSEDEIPATEELLSNIKHSMIEPKSNYAGSESSIGSGMVQLSESTQNLIDHGNRSIEMADKIFENPRKLTDMLQPKLPIAKNVGETVDMSAFSTESFLATTQKQRAVQEEVQDLKTKLSVLEELQKKKSGKESDNESEDLFTSLSPRKRSHRTTRKTAVTTKIMTCTALSPAEVDNVSEFASKMSTPSMQLRMFRLWDEVVTHIIVHVDENNATERTLKYLNGVAKGCWIVSYQWVLDSMEQGRLMPEDDYEVLDCTGMEGPKKSRLSQSKLFGNFAFNVVPPFSELTEEQLLEMIHLCGGFVVKTAEELHLSKRPVQVVLVDPSEEENAYFTPESFNYVRVACDWVLECVGVHQYVALPPYIVGEPTPEQMSLSNIPAKLLTDTQDVP